MKIETKEPARRMLKFFATSREVRKTTVEVKADGEDLDDADDPIAD